MSTLSGAEKEEEEEEHCKNKKNKEMTVPTRKGSSRYKYRGGVSWCCRQFWTGTAQLRKSLTILFVMLCLVMLWPRKASSFGDFWISNSTTSASNTTMTTTTSCSLWLDSSTPATALNSDCIRQIARVYSSHSDASKWCVAPYKPNAFVKNPQWIEQTEDVVGFIFIKNTKAASSTGAGVTLRIAEQVGKRVLLQLRQENYTTTTIPQHSCVRNFTHAFANHRGHAKRLPDQSLLWTILRQPAKRDVSAFFFFEHARKGVDINDKVLLDYLKRQKSGQFRYLHTQYIADDNLQPDFQNWYQQHEQNMSSIFHQMLETYNFIALAERLDESLAVMTLLWNLRPQDVIVLSAKTKGGYDDGKFQKQCHKIPEPQLTPAISEFLHSPEYLHHNLDVALYAAANVSLDKTIEALGREKVQERLNLIRRMQQVAEKQCQSEAIYPCSPDGKLQRNAARQSCYVDDSGCGHACVDRVLSAEFG